MADTIKSAFDLKFTLDFADGDTRAITYPNPRASLTASDIQTLKNTIAAKNFFVGDKAGAAFSGISNPKRVEKITRHLDLS